MKSKHQIATLLSLFLFLAPPLFSQHLRLVVFAATSAEDKGFAQGIKVSVSELRTLFGRLDTPELPLDSTFFIGDQFNIDQLENWLKTVDTHPDDFLIFYFLGHGNESSKSQYPQLIFHKDHELARRDMKKNTRNLEDIYMTLFEEHPTRGLLVIGDACNDPIEKAKTEAMSGSRKKKPKTPFRKSPDGDLSGCSTFLQESLSSLAISSSDKGNKAYLSKTEGSFFTQAFVQTMNTDCAKVPKDLSELFYKTAQVVDAIAADYDLEQKLIVDNPTKSKFNFKRMVQRIFFDGNDRRLMNKAFRNDDYSYFDVILGKTKSPETEQKIREQFLSKKPAAYYILSAITKAEKLATDSDLEKEAEVLLDYCTARAIYQSNKGLKTERDINIVKKLRKLDEEYEQLGISDYVNPGKWLDAKCIECKQGFEEKREQVLRLVDSLEREIISTQQAIVTLDSQEISVKKEIEALERELAAKDQSIKKTIQTITENGNIRVSIPEFPANFSANLQAALQAVIEGREVDTGSLTEYEKVWLSQVEVIYEPNEEMSPNVEDEIDLQAFAVGDHCSPRIINYTNTVLQSLLARTKSVPIEFRDSLDIRIEIEGYADYRGAGGLIGLFYAKKDYDYVYTNREGTRVPFRWRAGRSDQITNEQLAFLRAACSCDITQEILNQNGLQVPVENFTFYAIQQRDQDIDERDGADFRGVKIRWRITNLNQYLLKHLEMQQADRAKIIDQIKAKKDEVREIERKRKAANEHLEALTTQTIEAKDDEAFLTDRLNQVDPNRQGTVIDLRLKEVESHKEKR